MSAGLRSRNLILGIECFRRIEIVSQKGQNINLLFNSDIVNYLLKPMGGETKDLTCFFVVVFFCSLECFNCRWFDGVGVKKKVLFRAG